MSQVWLIVSGENRVGDQGYFRAEADAWARIAVKPIEDRRTFEGGLGVSYGDYCRIQPIGSSEHLFVIGMECASPSDTCCEDAAIPDETIWSPLDADGAIDPAHGWFTTEQEVRHLNFDRRLSAWQEREASTGAPTG